MCVYNIVQVCNGTSRNPYMNPRAPIHVVTGSAVRRQASDYLGFIELIDLLCLLTVLWTNISVIT